MTHFFKLDFRSLLLHTASNQASILVQSNGNMVKWPNKGATREYFNTKRYARVLQHNSYFVQKNTTRDVLQKQLLLRTKGRASTFTQLLLHTKERYARVLEHNSYFVQKGATREYFDTKALRASTSTQLWLRTKGRYARVLNTTLTSYKKALRASTRTQLLLRTKGRYARVL